MITQPPAKKQIAGPPELALDFTRKIDKIMVMRADIELDRQY
jgi:hypothetical protein